MVTMMTEMIGSPMRRRRNTRSTLMAMKNVMIQLQKGQCNGNSGPHGERVSYECPRGDELPWAMFKTRLDL